MSEYEVTNERRSTENLHVLLLDDEAPVRDALGRLLRALGHRCSVASTGEEVLELLRQDTNAAPEFDLALFDIKIIDGMGGVETMRAMERLGISFPIVSMSGYALTEIFASEDDRRGFVEHLQKPFGVKELKQVIQLVSSRPPSEFGK